MPSKMLRFCVRLGALVAILSLVFATSGYAADGVDWQSLSDTVIHTVVLKRALPVPVSPFRFAQDRAGFLWAGGQAGLLRWDGYQFRAYTPTAGRDDGLRNHYIQVLHADRGGTLWAGTEEGGLARYDEATDRFEPVVLADQRGEAQRVWSLDDDGAGGLWVGTNRGAAHLDAQHRIVPPLNMAGPFRSTVFAVPERKVEALVRSRQGTVWIGGASGLARIETDGRAIPVYLPSPDRIIPDVSNLMEDSAGRIWAGTRHRGAYIVDPSTQRARAVPLPAGLSMQDAGIEIASLEEVEPGRIWLSTFGHGILDVTEAGTKVRAIVRNPMVRTSLDSNLVYGLYKDRSGITWIGTSEAIDKFVPPAGGIFTLFGSPDLPRGIPADVTAVLARPDGSVWLGSETDGEGVVVLGADGKPVRTLKLPRVLCLAANTAGPVYIGTRSGLFVASPSGDSVRKVEFPSRPSDAGVGSLLVVGDALWVGGVDDNGLWEVRIAANGTFAVARHFASPPLPTASIESLALTQDGSLAVGTAQGLGLLNRATGRVENIVLDPAGQHDMATGQVVSFLTDRLGRLWIGTDDSGVAVMTGRDTAGHPLFHRITAADGLPDADINRMLADERGQVWVATDNGLAMIDPETFTVRALHGADGVAISTYLNLSGDRTPQGDLLFGGHGGLTVLRPQAVGTWRYKPPLAISEIRVGGKPVRTRSAEIVIKPSANSVSVEFAAMDFSAPARNIYRYMLEGFDPDFIMTDSSHRMASYMNLAPGNYVLRLQGSNRNGVWTDPVTCKIHVIPAWFQTIYVRFAEVALLILLGVCVAHGRTLWLKRHQLYLEGLINERTSELISSQQKLTQLAYFDALTALPNRRSFNETLRELLEAAEKPQFEFVLILIDLDGFKRVNDTLGHDAGDEVLMVAAGRLRAALREGDSVARLGGDEFAILLHRIKDHGIVETICDRVVTGMTASIDIKGQRVEIGASVGVALYPFHGRAAGELYKHADQALYDAKRAGKGIWRWYQEARLEDA